jgi:hypothetical protein
MPSPGSLPFLGIAVSATIAIPAQTTWTVTQQNGVQAAIAAAAPGDVILLPNTGGAPDYTPFDVNKGVTIVGNGCRIGWPTGGLPSFSITIQVPPGQRAHLDGLDMSWSPGIGSTGVGIVLQGGVVTMQRCTVVHYRGHAVWTFGGALVCQSCTLRAERYTGPTSGCGLNVGGGAVTLRDCVVEGMDAGFLLLSPTLLPAQPGANVALGSLHAERTQFVGGQGMLTVGGACGIMAANTATLWLADSTVVGGGAPGTGGPASALCSVAAAPVQLVNVTLTPGAPSVPPSVGGVVANAPLVRLAITPSFQRGATSTLSFAGEPGAPFVLALAFDTAPTSLTLVVEPVWLLGNAPVALGLLDAAGTFTMPVAVPAGPSLQHQFVWCQAVSGFALPLRATTIAGGLIR